MSMVRFSVMSLLQLCVYVLYVCTAVVAVTLQDSAKMMIKGNILV